MIIGVEMISCFSTTIHCEGPGFLHSPLMVLKLIVMQPHRAVLEPQQDAFLESQKVSGYSGKKKRTSRSNTGADAATNPAQRRRLIDQSARK